MSPFRFALGADRVEIRLREIDSIEEQLGSSGWSIFDGNNPAIILMTDGKPLKIRPLEGEWKQSIEAAMYEAPPIPVGRYRGQTR